MTIDWPRLAEIVASHESFLLTSHRRPDCDALGSEIAFAAILERLGKQVVILNADPVPPHLAFIDPAQRAKVLGVDHTLESPPEHDVLVVLDTCAWGQLGEMADLVRATPALKVVLDHHVGADDLNAVEFKNTTAVATGCLVVEAADALGVELTKEMADALFAAIATDTGWFRFRTVGADAYRTAARLLDAGAEPADVFTSLYEQSTPERVRLRGRILQRVQVKNNGRLAYTVVNQADFTETGALPGDTEDVVNVPLTIRGVEAALFFFEQTGGYKVSFRSRGPLDCNAVAGQFGGGGHKAASGAFVEGKWEEVESRVLDAVFQAMG